MANPNPVVWGQDSETGRFIAQLAADEFCDVTVNKAAEGAKLYSQGIGVMQICKQLQCSVSTLYGVWSSKNPKYAPIVEAYMRARKQRAMMGADTALDYAMDDTKDFTPDGKVNNAAVQRSRLIVDTLYRNASALDEAYKSNDGTQVNVNITINDQLASGLSRIVERVKD